MNKGIKTQGRRREGRKEERKEEGMEGRKKGGKEGGKEGRRGRESSKCNDNKQKVKRKAQF